jgi:hypothetical protein
MCIVEHEQAMFAEMDEGCMDAAAHDAMVGVGYE